MDHTVPPIIADHNSPYTGLPESSIGFDSVMSSGLVAGIDVPETWDWESYVPSVSK